MRIIKVVALLLLAAMLLAGCRFAVVEADSVRVEAPSAGTRRNSARQDFPKI